MPDTIADTAPPPGIFTYEKRRVAADPVLEVHGCRFKPYRIWHPGFDTSAAGAAPDIGALLRRAVPPEADPGFHDLGFAMTHQGRDGTYFLVARWYGGHNLGSDTYKVVTQPDGTDALRKLPLLACIWELALYTFERDAWVATVMRSGRGLEGAGAYLVQRLEGMV